MHPAPVQQSVLSRLHQSLFDRLYARSLLYNACWEDPACDRQALSLTDQDDVLVITSGGCNALDYLLCGPRRVTAVDANPRQTALLELKVAAIRCLDDDDVFAFFGTGRHPHAAHLYRVWLRPMLTPPSQAIWDRTIGWFNGTLGDSFYYHGLSGVVARMMRGYVLARPALRHAVTALLNATTLDEQQDIYDRRVAPLLWSRLMSWLMSRQATMSLLGVPPSQTADIVRHHNAVNGDQGARSSAVGGFVRGCVDRVFRELPLRRNYFWSCYLRGGYTRDNCPEYLKPHNLAVLRSGLLDRLEIRTGTVSGILEADERPFSRFVLLDHLDWMGAHRPADLNREWDLIMRRSSVAPLALFRSASAQPTWLSAATIASPNGSRHALRERLSFDHALASTLHAQDRVGTYGGFHIARWSA